MKRFHLYFQDVAYKTTFDNRSVSDNASILLGLANLMQWLTMIRYLGNNRKYYVSG